MKRQDQVRTLKRLFTQRPDGHYVFQVSEGVCVDRSVIEKWNKHAEIIFALRTQVEQARKRANESYDRLLNVIDSMAKEKP